MAPTVAGVCFRLFCRRLRVFRTSSREINYSSYSVRRSLDESRKLGFKSWPVRKLLLWNVYSCNFQRSVKQFATFIPEKTVVPAPEPVEPVDPFSVVKDDLKNLSKDIKKELDAYQPELNAVSEYYFDGRGKAIRPTIVLLMARALNVNAKNCKSFILPAQRQIALLAEMVHTATLIHDDVIDLSHTRRGKASANMIWGQRKAILAGDYIVSATGVMISRIGINDITDIFSEILLNLVQGELMQLGAKEREDDRFSHYILRNFKKTASLMAHCCKAVAIVGNKNEKLKELAFAYGRNVGIAFQLIDDVLDFESSASVLGKPTTADLKLGLATAPVLFACEKFPELNSLIMRRFNQPGDVEKALDCVVKSNGIQESRIMAEKHCAEAVKLIQQLTDSIERKALLAIPDMVLNRVK